MENFKSKFTNIKSLFLEKSSHELFFAEYDGSPVVIKCFFNVERGTLNLCDDVFVQSNIVPQEVLVYQRLSQIEEVKFCVPKYYTYIQADSFEDFDNRWLLENENKFIHAIAYLIIERLDANPIWYCEVHLDWEKISKQLQNNYNLLCKHGIKHNDVMEDNILFDKDSNVYFIDFENSIINCDNPKHLSTKGAKCIVDDLRALI